MFVEPEFHFLQEKLVSTTLNTTGARVNVPEVESQIQVIKERMRAHHANLPLISFTMRKTVDLAKHIVMFLNALPSKNGMSKTYSPRTIMTGKVQIGVK